MARLTWIDYLWAILKRVLCDALHINRSPYAPIQWNMGVGKKYAFYGRYVTGNAWYHIWETQSGKYVLTNFGRSICRRSCSAEVIGTFKGKEALIKKLSLSNSNGYTSLLDTWGCVDPEVYPHTTQWQHLD